MMHNSDLNLTRRYTAPAGVQHCSRCHVSCTNQPEDLGSKPGSTGHCDLKQIRYWLKTNIISSFKPSQTLAPTSLTDLEILGAPSSLQGFSPTFSLEGGGGAPFQPHRERPTMQSQAVILPSYITSVPSILSEYFEQHQQKCKLDLFAAVCNEWPSKRKRHVIFAQTSLSRKLLPVVKISV